MRILILTGANGALGKEVLFQIGCYLDPEKWHIVVNDLFLEDKSHPFLENISFIEGDISFKHVMNDIEREVTRRAHNGCWEPYAPGVIINCAASLKLSTPYQEIKKINTDVPLNLQVIAQRYELKMIHISSCSIYKQLPSYEPISINEAFPLGFTSNYERSKIEADEELLKNNRGELTILRPGLIYGKRTKHLGSLIATIPTILKTHGIKHIPNITGGPLTNWTDVTMLSRLIVMMVKCHDYGKNTIYNVVETEPNAFGDTISMVCKLEGVTPVGPKIYIPKPQYFKNYFNKLLKTKTTFATLNFILGFLWGNTETFNTSQLNINLEHDMCSYLEGDMVFDNTRFLNWMKDSELVPLSDLNRNKLNWVQALGWYKNNKWIS